MQEKDGLNENGFSGNEYTEFGNKLETKIRDYINSQEFTNKTVIEDKKVAGDISYYVILYNGETVLEIKTTSKINNNVDDYEVFLDQLLFYIQYMKSKKGLLDVYNRPIDLMRNFNLKDNPFITEEELLPVDLTELSNKLVAVEKQLVLYDELAKHQKELKAQLKAAIEKGNIKK